MRLLLVMIPSVMLVGQFATGSDAIALAVKAKGWCREGLVVDRVALSRPWSVRQSEKVVITTDPPVGPIRFEVFKAGISGTALVRCRENILTAARDLTPGEVFDTQNTQFAAVEISQLTRSGVFRDRTDLSALEVRGFVRRGTILTRLQTQKVTWVVAGNPVTLIHEKNGLRLSTSARALQSGKPNDWIRVENTTSRKVVVARVSGPQTVSSQ